MSVIKQDVLIKRAIGKGLIKNFSLRERLFVLTHDYLTYYEGNGKEGKKGKEMGKLSLSKVRAVEKVKDNTFTKPHCFQVVFDDYPLYVFAGSENQRDEWIHSLRKELTKQGVLQNTYHEGAYLGNVWTCCREKLRSAMGCQSTFIDLPEVEPPKLEETQSTEKHFKVTAKFSYNPVQDSDMELHKDQEYTVVDVTSDQNWWKARDSLGREGYIPSNFVTKHLGIESEKWYHKNVRRQEADAILKDKEMKDGTFLVHDSSRPAMYTLSFCFQKEIKHYHIKLDSEGKYYVSQRHHFETIAELIEYHKLNSAGLVTRLRFPYTGFDEPPVTLGHGVFEIDDSELKIKGKIGQGQFGTVHEASWKGKEKVAVKMMKEGTMEQHDFIEEAKLMQRFQHKNLVTIYGISYGSSYGGGTGTLRIVVEFMQNGALLDYLRKNTNMKKDVDKLLDIITQVSHAMEYLEEEKFIHRDLAARNCLVGNNNVIKVADFGLARYVLDDEYTASEGTKFPIRWAAPEVIDYTKFSSKSDVWAFGILCWEVFTCGTLPYTGKTNPEIVDEVRNGKRLTRPDNCKEDIFKIMQQSWEQSPDQRPSFKEICTFLASVTEDYCD